MRLNSHNPKVVLNKAFLKQRPVRSEIELFKAKLKELLAKVQGKESEDHKKTFVRDFLLDVYYKDRNEINTKDRKDLVIHLGKKAADTVGVIIEAKAPGNTPEMMRREKPNVKAFHELVKYYFDEREAANNSELKNLVVTNAFEWFIFDANVFDKLIYRNTQIKRLYETYRNDKKDTKFFYEEARKIFDGLDVEIDCAYFNLKNYQALLETDATADDKDLIALFKVLSPVHLLKEPFANDSNSLNKPFYDELLHIIGLEEIKAGGKTVIQRKDAARRDAGSLIENAISILETEDSLTIVSDVQSYGETREQKLFNVALELCLTWINRVLFLKLLESQLVNYHKGNADYRFLNVKTIPDFAELYKLFHQVLAVNVAERNGSLQAKYERVPYLNSSLFEISELEKETLRINQLDGNSELKFIGNTILKELKTRTSGLNTLEYLFRFLDAYDFASEGASEVQEDNRSLINASVLGKVFEKINGYKDGSIFTPGFITMYMCRQAIRLAVVQKFNDKYKADISDFDELKNFVGANSYKTEKLIEYNEVINSLKLCDPAVGSGHFLVSSLNEIIAIKSELGLLVNENNVRLSDFEIQIENDELIITDGDGDIFEYQINQDGKPSKKAQNLQKTLFHEKQRLIENCLFGVDINPNSVKICRLRLWIELLKNAYYKEAEFAELETLPNIDINIKTGNSLLSRFALDADLKDVLKTAKYNIADYRSFVSQYKETRSREAKRDFESKIRNIKNELRTEIFKQHPKMLELLKKERRFFEINSPQLFEKYSDGERERLSERLNIEIAKTKDEIEAIKSNLIYRNAFEWRFEFPEVLSDDGEFLGFDVVIGNPPYIEARSSVIDEKLKDEILKNIRRRREEEDANLITRGADILIYFFEQGLGIIKNTGFFSFITQNAWLDTDYGFKFQKFLRNNTQILGVFDDEIKYFDESANINTIITLFKGNQAVEGNKVNFIKFKVGFEDAPFELNQIEKLKDKGQLNTFQQDDEILSQMKWGVILNSDDLIIDLHKRLLEKESKNQPKFKIGQGLNLTKDFVISGELASKLEISGTHLHPFFTNDDGALFEINKTTNYLVEAANLSLSEKENLQNENIKAVELSNSKRQIPSLILPRGVGRFFCATNLCNAFSSSFVEIYLEDEANYLNAQLYLWTFLNSSVGWLIREISGRKNLGGGMLKAEATDLKNYPIYFDLEDDLMAIKALYRKLSQRQAANILSELETPEHLEIDSIVFDKLQYNEDDRKRLKQKFIDLVTLRINKSIGSNRSSS